MAQRPTSLKEKPRRPCHGGPRVQPETLRVCPSQPARRAGCMQLSAAEAAIDARARRPLRCTRMNARTYLGFGLMIGLACSQPQPVAAQSAAAQASAEQNYDELIRQAVTEFSLGHWTEAKVFFARAHARNPNARTLRGLGLSCYEARSYV